MILMTSVWIGQFHGEISAQTPIGSRRTMALPDARLEGVLAQNLAGHPHVVGWARDLSAVADRNADLARDQLGELVDVGLVHLDDAVDQRDAFLHRRGREALERASSRDDRAVGVRSAAQSDPGEGLLAGRVDELNFTRVDRINPSDRRYRGADTAS